MASDKAISSMFKLMDNHKVYSRLYGDGFSAKVEEWEPIFSKHAQALGTDGILETAIDMGKIISDQGQNPGLMFAVAVELINRKEAQCCTSSPR